MRDELIYADEFIEWFELDFGHSLRVIYENELETNGCRIYWDDDCS